MKILVIHGSMRKGNTYTLTKEIVSRLAAKAEVEISEYFVSELNLPFCCSCHNCFAKGEEYCPHFDVTGKIKDALLQCDALVVSGATYMWALNAAMKNLLDHFAYMFHRPVLFGKKGMVVATSTGVGEKSVAKYLKTVLGQWGINGAIIVTQNAKEHRLQSEGPELSSKEAAQIDKVAQRFYDMIKANKQLTPSLKNISVHNAFRAMSLSAYSESERDTQHWQKEGMGDRAYPVKAGPIKYAIGAFVYGAAKNTTKMIGRVYMKRQGEQK